ncbi:hypothetical protein BT96DRAFT_940529 [Gymnopus androsaceus JB14]|uniref:Uncharacterized protein n=1 Tax=Gymnopus androsaceus JB14 TaxID=1447944 RepID=A0A6A4HKD6_9AGAR|nr:hypothetical protein BT96DRAFT_940529 [Gymnopus androsaceus JB14]
MPNANPPVTPPPTYTHNTAHAAPAQAGTAHQAVARKAKKGESTDILLQVVEMIKQNYLNEFLKQVKKHDLNFAGSKGEAPFENITVNVGLRNKNVAAINRVFQNHYHHKMKTVRPGSGIVISCEEANKIIASIRELHAPCTGWEFFKVQRADDIQQLTKDERSQWDEDAKEVNLAGNQRRLEMALAVLFRALATSGHIGPLEALLVYSYCDERQDVQTRNDTSFSVGSSGQDFAAETIGETKFLKSYVKLFHDWVVEALPLVQEGDLFSYDNQGFALFPDLNFTDFKMKDIQMLVKEFFGKIWGKQYGSEIPWDKIKEDPQSFYNEQWRWLNIYKRDLVFVSVNVSKAFSLLALLVLQRLPQLQDTNKSPLPLFLKRLLPFLLENRLPFLLNTRHPPLLENPLRPLLKNQLSFLFESRLPPLLESRLPFLFESRLPPLLESQLPFLFESQLPPLFESQLPFLFEIRFLPLLENRLTFLLKSPPLFRPRLPAPALISEGEGRAASASGATWGPSATIDELSASNQDATGPLRRSTRGHRKTASSNEAGPSGRDVIIPGKKQSRFWSYTLKPIPGSVPVEDSATTSNDIGGGRTRKRGQSVNEEVDTRGTQENIGVQQPLKKKRKS